MEASSQAINEDRLSRQLAVYGHETQGKLMAMKVFIHGITGVGLEVAKNLILAGPKAVVLFDQAIVSVADLGRNFYCHSNNVGVSTRAQACLSQLRELNSSVNVSVSDSDSVDYIISNFNCVVVLDNYHKEYLIRLNKACHANSLGFILAGNLGLYGYAFVDFGQNHRVSDLIGKQSSILHIAGITQEEQGEVTLHIGNLNILNDDDIVLFKGVEGMTEINGKQYKIKIKSQNKFTVGDTRGFSPYLNGGVALEQKVPVFFKSFDLEKSLRYPYPPESREMPIASWDIVGQPEQLHMILNAVYKFVEKHQQLPTLLSKEHANQLISLLEEHLKEHSSDAQGQQFKVETVDRDLIRNVALYAQCQISPCSSFWGGIVTQEIVKFTGKYTPLRQWLHHEFFSVLPKEATASTIKDNDYSLLFGDEFVHKAAASSCFVVGAGALGCQFIKMFAQMGFATEGGKVTVTDDDNIEISNLNRQFLFRKQHIGKNKSEVACAVGRGMNPKADFTSVKLRVGLESEDVFNDDFWTKQDFVVNAVDNVKARKFIDDQCVWHLKPLFESGTMGTQCHSQVIIPYETVSYSDRVDPPAQSIPVCTLKNFPYQIEHTIQWARDYFEGVFAVPSAELVGFYENSDGFLLNLTEQHRENPNTLKCKLESLEKLISINESKSYEKCVEVAVLIFEDVFNHQILNLLRTFPADTIAQGTQKPFWSGLRKLPIPLKLDFNDKIHVKFLQSGANILAAMLNIPMISDKKNVIEIAKKIELPVYDSKKVDLEIQGSEGKVDFEIKSFTKVYKKQAGILLDRLTQVKVDKSHMPRLVQFEKDDSTNFHIEFVSAVSNLRARNYKIEEVDNFKVKLIAGKIIPAIATTTAMVVGVIGIEIIKYLTAGDKAPFRNCNINLALPLWIFMHPSKAIQFRDKEYDSVLCGPVKMIPNNFTKWEKINLKGPMTVRELKAYLQQAYGIQVLMINYGKCSIFSTLRAGYEDILEMQLQTAIEAVSKKEFPKGRKFIPFEVNGMKDSVDCVLPCVRYQIVPS